ncbi:MAG TPA: type II secretion system F family protein [Verrucomicrobiae bacterium]
MSNYAFEAIDASGALSSGTLEVTDQMEALRRIREMGLFPTNVRPATVRPSRLRIVRRHKTISVPRWLPGQRVKPMAIAVFTRQLATLVDVGIPLLRGLRLLQEQEENPALKRVIGDLATTIETGEPLSVALAAHPRIFDPLYVNMVKAGETGGVLELVLKRQADLMEKGLKIRGKIQAGMFYPVAVLLVAMAIMTLLLMFVIPRFQEVFQGLLPGGQMPAFTVAVLRISEVFRSHFLTVAMTMAALFVVFKLSICTKAGRYWFDRCKLNLPIFGKFFRKVALSRFSRTLGTLLSSGVPILQALNLGRETAGNVIVGDMIGRIHDNVEEGGTVAEPLKAAHIFPAMVGGMVDVGEQSGALPDMLSKIADTADEDVDNAVTSLTSLLEPVMIVFLALIVGSIVIAMFMPLAKLMMNADTFGGGN